MKTLLERFEGRRRLLWLLAVVAIAACIAIGLGVGLTRSSSEPILGEDYRPSVLGNYSRAAVSVDGKPCAKIGKDVLLAGGTAVDAAIAALFCDGVYNCQSMGLGGGFLMTIYSAKDRKAESLIARERAPLAASEDMYHGNSALSQTGALAVAVPGEIAGYWEAKNRYGNKSISWQRLVQPTVDMCRNGITVSWTLARILREKPIEDLKMREVFINPATGEPWNVGDIYYRRDFADTLEQLAKNGDEGEERLGFYSGSIAEKLVADLKELGGIITMEDMMRYSAEWAKPVQVSLSNRDLTVYSVPPPGSGVIMAYILNILDLYNVTRGDESPLFYHRVTEAFKWAYALRTELGDPYDPDITDIINELVSNITSEAWANDRHFQIDDNKTVNNASHYGAVFYTPDDHGTAHVSVLAENGDAVSATSTINLYFGARIMSKSTGIIYNDEMDDFSAPNITNYFGIPPSPHNFIKGGKRPLSSMCPTVVVDREGKAVLVLGAAGGTKITTSVSLAVIRNLWLGQNIKEAIDARRIHHQLAPMEVSFEPDFPQVYLRGLESRGHVTAPMDSFGSVLCGITRGEDGRVYANADFRKAGATDGY